MLKDRRNSFGIKEFEKEDEYDEKKSGCETAAGKRII